jgi:hypothetical protein
LLIAGRIASLIAILLSAAFLLIGISNAKKKMPTLRPIAGLDALEEAVGRATEMGKPVFDTIGYADVAGTSAAPTLAGLDVLSHVARLTARYETQLSVAVGHPNAYPLAQEVVKGAYTIEGKPEAYHEDMLVFTSEIQFAFTAASLGIIQRDKPAACLFIGYFAAEAIVISEAAMAVGAIAIAGATNFFQLPFFAAACDYTMIGEEFLAAGAFISGQPSRTGAIAGQDYVKLASALLILIGAVLATFKDQTLGNLLKL